MLSLETAEKLKEFNILGLPVHGDEIFCGLAKRCGIYHVNGLVYFDDGKYITYNPDTCVKIPRLGQMLAWIEEQGLCYELTSYPANYCEETSETYPKTYVIKLFDDEGHVPFIAGEMADIFISDEAAAQAILYMLKSGAPNGKA